MNKIIKYSLIGLGTLLILVLGLVALIAATFNPNDYKPLIIKLVQEKKQRTLHLDGDIKLAFWPKIGADLGKISLSEHNSPQQFAAVESAKVSLALLPLLKNELVVDTVYVDGVSANIVRHKDGSTNFDDLLSNDDEESKQIKFDIDGVNVSNASLSFSDESTGAQYAIKQFKLKAGHVALKTPFDLSTEFVAQANQPKINAQITLQGNFMADPEAKHFVVKGLDTHITGDLATLNQGDIQLSGDVDVQPEHMQLLVDSLKLAIAGNLQGAKLKAEFAAPKLVVQENEVSGKAAKLSFSQDKGSDSINANLVLADIKGSPKAIQSSGISGDFKAKQGEREITGKFASPFAGNIEKLIFDLPKLAGNIDIKDPSLPNGGIKGEFALKLHSDIKQESVTSDFALNIDNSKLKGDVALTSFSKPNIQFNLNADQLDLNKLLGNKPGAKAEAKTDSAPAKATDLSALKNLLLQGKVLVGSIVYDKYRLANLNLAIKADGEQLTINPFAVKFDESNIQGSLGISRFAKPIYHFDVDIDKLDADKYIAKSEAKPSQASSKSNPDAPIDLSALKQINADGELRIGALKVANVKSSNVRIKLQADDGVAQLSPFSANLYQGSMNGSVKVDARSTPVINVKQAMTGIQIGPLLVDALQNDMLSGKGSLNVDLTTAGNTVGALKKALNGTTALNLADGSVKGIDIAGTIRGVKDKLNVLKSQSSVASDSSKKTDFSEMVASFTIKNGVAHNEDLSMKAPLFRITGSGDVDIGNETINYTAKPTVVASLKGQGGAGLDEMNGVTIPVKLSGSFAKPDYNIDFAAVASALAQQKLLDKVGGSKGEALKSLLGGKKTESAPADSSKPAPATVEDKAKQKLNKLLGF